CEMYVAPRGHRDRSARDEYHLTVLAADMQGYRNLIKLVSIGFLDGYYYKPRVDLELLERYNQGLIVLSGCLGSGVSQHLLHDRLPQAKALIADYRAIFGQRYFLEIHHHHHAMEDKVRSALLEIARETGIRAVAANDFHYLRKDDAPAHDVLLCIGTGKMVADAERMRFEGDDFYFKNSDEMYSLFAQNREACATTSDIADMVDVRIETKSFAIPAFPVPPEETDDNSFLRSLCLRGLRERYGEPTPEHVSRLEYELGIIERMGYGSYFLIVWDFIRYARESGIPVGPGRGSAAGSIVAYVLRIADVDPLRYNLFFERFLNPERISMPDIDTDFCFERRDEVIRYVIDRYGVDQVAQIVTFGTMAARAAVRDVGRVTGVPLSEVDRIAKMIPVIPTNPMTIRQAIDAVPDLAASYQRDPATRALLETAMRVEGLARHASTHAAGVVIAPGPITDFAPLVKLGDNIVNTQYSMEWVERIGLLKMDILGLRTLTVMQSAADEIRRTADADFTLENIPLDDAKTYGLLSAGQTTGVFQLESAGMRRYIAELRPSRIEDVIAMVALYRPGPMDWIADFIAGKQKRRAITYLHPRLEPILEETYGIAVYQEQVMQMCRDLAGYSVGQADSMRKVIGKKIKEKIPAEREKFIAGCMEHGLDEALSAQIWQFIEPFAGYGFAKAHAVCYGLLAYRTAWLKANYPLAFMAALLTSMMHNTDKLVEYLAECAQVGLPILPPDVNESGTDFTVVQGAIRFGLRAVKNVGGGAIAELLEKRRDGPFSSLADICLRVDCRQVNRRVMESLIKAGALDTLSGSRAQNLAAVDAALDYGQRAAREKDLGQTSLFGAGGSAPLPPPALPIVAEPAAAVRLTQEREAIGVYISGHPLTSRLTELKRRTTSTIRRIRELPEDELVVVGGVVAVARKVVTKAGGQMVVAKLEDMTGAVEVVVFPKWYPNLAPVLVADAVVVIKGRIKERTSPGRTAVTPSDSSETGDDERAEITVAALEAWPLDGAPIVAGATMPGASRDLHVRLSGDSDDAGRLGKLREIVLAAPGGSARVVLHVGRNGDNRPLKQAVALTQSLRDELSRLFGAGNVWEAASA
ncbi:MAG: DNA polymerase III subunit alpha, partial [Candidatus Eremiobacteraeota bacterium]|nr:DNA polymerase III subunit alpha [Candidatus Eremiobacteraeota bacterium]